MPTISANPALANTLKRLRSEEEPGAIGPPHARPRLASRPVDTNDTSDTLVAGPATRAATNSPFPATTSAVAITSPVIIIGTKCLCPFESGHSRPIKRRRIRVYNKKRRIWVDNSGDGIDVPGSTGNEEHQPLAGAEQYIGTSSASATYFEDPYDYDFDIDPKSAAGIHQAAIFILGAADSANASRSSSVSGSKSTSRSSPSNQNSRFNLLSTLNRGSRTTRHAGSDEASLMRGLGIGMFNNLGSGRIIRGVSQEVAKIDSEEDDGSDDDSDTLSIIPAPELSFPKGNVIASLVENMRLNFGPTPTDHSDLAT
ncbi:hypothetical protein GGF41_005424, partial [Coemansia sp. RSA 2531]